MDGADDRRVERRQEGDDVERGVDVEAGRRLVDEQELGGLDERGGERETLLLAAGQTLVSAKNIFYKF